MTYLLRLSVATVALAGGVWSWGVGDAAAIASLPQAPTTAARSWTETELWLAPVIEPAGLSAVARGAELVASGEAAQALHLLAPSVGDPELGVYARLHLGRAYFALNRPVDAAAEARAIIATAPGGYAGESALWLLAEALEHDGKWADALATWQAVSGLPGRSSAATVQLRLAQAAEKAGDRVLARGAYARLFFEFPEAPESDAAETALARFPPSSDTDTTRLELTRAARLFDARRFTAAHRAYERVSGRTTGVERQLVELRLAQCDVSLQRFARGLDSLAAWLTRPQTAQRADAEFAVLAALRGLKRADYPVRVSRFVNDYPTSPLAEAALNDLATHYILANDDGRAAVVFTEMYAKYPGGAFADRAAWRAGWWAYRQGNHRETIRLFESAAMSLRRADYRPGWVYWTARSYEAIGQRDTARLWYLRTIGDYRNSYYGREATRAFRALAGRAPTAAEVLAERDPARAIVAGSAPADAVRVQRLLRAALWDDAVAELRRLQAATGGNPVIEATIAYALNRKGELRPAITAMRRAYPQFMSAGGELLPDRILKVIFPVAHRDTLRRYAEERQLDLYLVTALVAQESTFQADVVSSANAVGLMQLLPSTGRQYAVRTGLRGFTPSQLTDPETNVRLGTAYLSWLLSRYGNDVASALAAYNAGEGRVDRWRADRPGLPRDEFVDDIPFLETQNYVKRIIGTAEDYRLLYGREATSAGGGIR